MGLTLYYLLLKKLDWFGMIVVFFLLKKSDLFDTTFFGCKMWQHGILPFNLALIVFQATCTVLSLNDGAFTASKMIGSGATRLVSSTGCLLIRFFPSKGIIMRINTTTVRICGTISLMETIGDCGSKEKHIKLIKNVF